jgi:hypothetical protein
MGLSLSSSKKNVDFDRYEWRATHACQTNSHLHDGNYTDHASANGYNFDKSQQLAADGNLLQLGNEPEGKTIQDLLTTDGSDFGDKIGFSMWIKPMWSHSGSSTSGGFTSSSGPNLLLFQMNGPYTGTSGSERHIFAYINYRSGSSFRNRLTVWVDDGDDRAANQRAFHDVNSITGTGSGNSTSSIWDEANPGNTNSEGYVHLVFTRGEQTGAAAWDVYWNAQDLGMNIDIGQGDDDPEIPGDNTNFLGIGTYRAHTSSYNSGDVYNFGMTPMRIRDFAVFPFEVSSSQVTSLYNSGNFSDVRTTMAAEEQPILYYPLNHNTADYMRNSADLSGDISFVGL